MHTSETNPVAVVGIAAELPSGTYSDENLDYQSFAKFLFDKGESYEKIPQNRFNIDALRGAALGQIVTDKGSFLKNLDRFDYQEFGISAKDARSMSVSTRKLVELAFLSLLDSGIDYRGKNVGSYMSGIVHDKWMLSCQNELEMPGSFSYLPSMTANRVSYHLDLRGPSTPTDTACSSSMTALHLAVQALKHGECDAAVVGGSQINHRFLDWILYSQGGILAPDGKCKPFDASADGFSRSEGAVVVTLKPLESAVRDGDRIYATVLGTGINSSGSQAPPNAPVAESQVEAMRRAFAQAKRIPQTVDFVELHATGTSRGDPTEANWAGAACSRDDELLVGSVKGNIGHLEITAFLASLCKVCIMFETGSIPPNVNFHNPNPAIGWNEYKLRVPVETTVLPKRSVNGLHLVSMASTGIGGANGHCVVESPPPLGDPKTFWCFGVDVPHLFIAGGLSPHSLESIIQNIMSTRLDTDDLPLISTIYGRRSRSMLWRSFGIASKGSQIAFAASNLIPRVTPPLVFVFSGQGPQYFDMGREMFNKCAAFRSSVLEMDEIYRSVVGTSLVTQTGLFETREDGVPNDSLGDLWPISITLPAITILQIALFDALVELGVEPDIVLGHSAGETAVLYASGAGCKEMAVELAIARGQAGSIVEEHDGTMAALACSPETAEAIIIDVIAELGDAPLHIGCYNSADSVTLSGKVSHIDNAVQRASAAGIFARRLRTRVPVHSPMMDVCEDRYRSAVGKIFSRYPVVQPTIRTFSTMTGALFEDLFSADYFWTSTRGPVLFSDAVSSLVSRHGPPSFVEIGPHPVLKSYLSALAGPASSVVCPLRRPKQDGLSLEVYGFVEALGQLVVAGHNCVDFNVLNARNTVPMKVAPYPFIPKQIPIDLPSTSNTKARQHRNGVMNYPQLHVSIQTHPYLADHIIGGETIMPASGYIEMALEYGAKALYDVHFVSILPLFRDKPVSVNVSLDGPHWRVATCSRDLASTWPPLFDHVHAEGLLLQEPGVEEDLPLLDLKTIRERCKMVDMGGFYETLKSFAQYGPQYQRVSSFYPGNDEALVEVRGDDLDLTDLDKLVLHPAILDASVHVLVHPLFTKNLERYAYYLPSGVKRLLLHEAFVAYKMPPTIFAHATLKRWTPTALEYDVVIVDNTGTRLCTMIGFEVALHGQGPTHGLDAAFELVSQRTELLLEPRDLSPDSDFAETRLPLQPFSTVGSKPKRLVVEYFRGQEISMQFRLRGYSPDDPLLLWVVAMAGIDGDAALGFTRSLRREYKDWVVRLAIFHSSWSRTEIQSVLRLLEDQSPDLEFFVDTAGAVYIPRITLAPPVSTPSVPFDPSRSWSFDGATVRHVVLPSPYEGHEALEVLAISESHDGFWNFLGRSTDSVQLKMGFSPMPITNQVLIHRGAVVDLLEELPDVVTKDLPDAVCLAAAVLAIGIHTFNNPSRLRNPLLVTHADTVVGSKILSLYSAKGIVAEAISQHATPGELAALQGNKYEAIVSGYPAGLFNGLLQRCTVRAGRVFTWNDPTSGIHCAFRDEPWSVGDAIRSALPYVTNETKIAMKLPAEILSVCPGTQVPTDDHILSNSRVHLLLGGIGSLGMRIALWMYQNGARRIILTSRSGCIKDHDIASTRIYNYLQSLPDISLQLVAVDSTSEQAMTILLKNIPKPLGGCLLLSGVLSDRSFSQHSEESFEAPYAPKVQSLEVLARVLDAESLDFLITFGSVAGLFGNAGQTNYASANTLLEGMTRRFNNAFHIVVPALTDTVMGHVDNWRIKHYTNWGMTSREFCDHLGLALQRFRERPYNTYIPCFDWKSVSRNLGSSAMYDYLVPADIQTGDNPEESASKPQGITAIVCDVLSLAIEDLSPEVPLTSYGLDSLSASTLSYALRPLLQISQIQLLADMTLNELNTRLEATVPEETVSFDEPQKKGSEIRG
ncbi:ketoacyl-synt-domain-containing protein [Mycena vitilis]|nr:ketoacyl-synt-domain-containing protein [Mycena vitilis]